MADGGEGTMAAIASSRATRLFDVPTRGMTEGGAPQQGAWLSLSGRGIVELSLVSGFTRPQDGGGPEGRSTYPVGELMCAALDAGVSELILAVGGSATMDAGLGLLQALGAICTVAGAPLERMCTAADLSRLDAIDLGPAQERLGRTKLSVAVDVQNPLCGEQGSARVYGLQKGATAQTIPAFEAGFEALVGLLGCPADVPGDGAAGGVGYGVRAGLGATLIPGASLVSELIGLPQACAESSVVITGEGCYDDQTQWGKVAWEVGRMAQTSQSRCALVAGQIRRSEEALQNDPFERHISLSDSALQNRPMATEDDLRRAGARLATALFPE